MADNLAADDNRPWHVEIPDVDIEFDVDAVYLAKDDNLPGWTVLKDHRHKIVAIVRDDAKPVLYIERTDAMVDQRLPLRAQASG